MIRTESGVSAAREQNQGQYRALLLDLDGTLLDGAGEIRPRNLAALAGLTAHGVRPVVVTGRSAVSTVPILERLGLEAPAIVFNGAGVWCPRRKRLIEERVLSNRTMDRALRLGRSLDCLTVVMGAREKFGVAPRDEDERFALTGLMGLRVVEREALPAEYMMRVTYFSNRHGSSAELALAVEDHIGHPVYLTHFPLRALPTHRTSPLQVVDVHPPCAGKAEAFRVLSDLYGIRPEQTVAVGDATNDLPMFERAGLSVAMGDGMPEAIAAADRVIGSHDSDAIADLVEELFG
jgi:hydroxymethylpyrimidine pyrophosphatase-like HAD family hydrolase